MTREPKPIIHNGKVHHPVAADYPRTFMVSEIKIGDMMVAYRKGQVSQQWIVTSISPDVVKVYVSFSHNQSYLHSGREFEFYKSSFLSWQTKNKWELRVA